MHRFDNRRRLVYHDSIKGFKVGICPQFTSAARYGLTTVIKRQRRPTSGCLAVNAVNMKLVVASSVGRSRIVTPPVGFEPHQPTQYLESNIHVFPRYLMHGVADGTWKPPASSPLRLFFVWEIGVGVR
jgi:hypothetical protein